MSNAEAMQALLRDFFWLEISRDQQLLLKRNPEAGKYWARWYSASTPERGRNEHC